MRHLETRVAETQQGRDKPIQVIASSVRRWILCSSPAASAAEATALEASVVFSVAGAAAKLGSECKALKRLADSKVTKS